jgi:hypothetical protein
VAPETALSRQPDAAIFYKAAGDALNVRYPESLKNGPHQLIDAPVPLQRPVVEQAQPAFALLRQGMRYSYKRDTGARYFAVETDGAGEIPAYDFAPYRDMARLLAVEARVKGASGDSYGALQSSLDAIRLGGDCGQGPSLLEGMVGVLCKMIGTMEAVRHIDGLSAPEARAAIQRLQNILESERPFAEIMTDERDTMSYDTLETVFRDGTLHGVNPNTGEAIDLRSSPWRFAIGATIFVCTKQGIVNDFAEQYDRILDRAKMPYQVTARLSPLPPSASPLVRYWLGNNYARAHYQTVLQSAYNRVLLTQLAIQAYRGEHKGAAPVSLENLTSGQKPYLRSIPRDPFSRTEKSPLCYDAKKAKAYSVGENARDDANRGDDNLRLYKG